MPVASLPANAFSIGPELGVAMVSAGPSIRALEEPSLSTAAKISFHEGDTAAAMEPPASLVALAAPLASVAPAASVAPPLSVAPERPITPTLSVSAVAVASTVLSAPPAASAPSAAPLPPLTVSTIAPLIFEAPPESGMSPAGVLEAPLTERPESVQRFAPSSRNEGGPIRRDQCFIVAPLRSCTFDASAAERVNTQSTNCPSEGPPPRYAEHPPKATDNANQELDVLSNVVSTPPERPSVIEAPPTAAESFVPSQAPVAVMKSLRAFAMPSRPPSERVSGAVLSLPPEPPSDQDPLWRLREDGHAPRSLRQASRRRWG
jgi:hypothetical protein